MRCQSCEDHGFHDYRFCSCCGRPLVGAACSDGQECQHAGPLGHSEESGAGGTTEADGQCCDCCGGPWSGNGTLCDVCERVFGRVLDAPSPSEREGSSVHNAADTEAPADGVRSSAWDPPAAPEPVPSAEFPAPPVSAVAASGPDVPPPAWWEIPPVPPTRLPLPPAPPPEATSPKLTAVIAVPPPLTRLAPLPASPALPQAAMTATPSKASRPRAIPRPVLERPRLGVRAEHLVKAALGGVVLVILLVLGVPAFQPPNGTDEGVAAPTAADAATAAPAGAVAADTNVGPAEPSPAAPVTPPAAAPATSAAASTRTLPPAVTSQGTPPSRSLKSNARLKPVPPKKPVKNEVVEPTPAAVVVPERSVPVPLQPPPAMASVEAVPAPALGPTFEPGQVDVRPRVETQVAATVPEHLRRRRLHDVVILRVRVSAGGRPADVHVLRKSAVDAALDNAAVAAVKRWRFSPARRRGEAVNCWLNVGVPFQSDEQEGTR